MNALGRKGNIMDKFLWKPFLAEEGAGAGAGGDDTKTEPQEPLTFDKMLEMDGMQAEFDRRLSKGIDTAVKNAVEKERTRLVERCPKFGYSFNFITKRIRATMNGNPIKNKIVLM